MTALGRTRQPCANRGALTLGVYAWHPLKGKPTANREPLTLGSTPPTVRQPTLVNDGTLEALGAFEDRAPAHLSARPKGDRLFIERGEGSQP